MYTVYAVSGWPWGLKTSPVDAGIVAKVAPIIPTSNFNLERLIVFYKTYFIVT